MPELGSVLLWIFKKGCLFLLLLLFLATTSKEGAAMSFLKKPVLFSEVTGVVLDNGKPLSNVRIDRILIEEDDEIVDSTYTDKDGNFHFKPIFRKRFKLFDLVPHEVVITQSIIINHQNEEYKGFMCVKRNYDNNGELRGRPISLLCDINDPYVSNGGFKGICRLR